MGHTKKSQTSEYDIIVVGSGIAGLYAALSAAEFARVCLVTKGKLQDTNTWLAQGGIAAAVGNDDSPRQHLEDTLAAGVDICDPAAVAVMVEEGPRRVAELMSLGTPFDRIDGSLALTREGAHHHNRVLHCGGDATGRLIQETMQSTLLKSKSVTIRQHVFVTELLQHEGTVCGIRTVTGEEIRAGAVILATGGLGQVFARTTNPEVATGDGVAMAYRAGARVADMEFVQFHPTVFRGRSEQETFLISEAVRGEGAVLRNRRGERFMDDYHPMAELGPRDVVARAILQEMKKEDGGDVFLDITHKGQAFLQKRFPTIYQKAGERGLNMAQDWLPVSPAAHYAMGGVVTGLNGQTSLPGLYACGEVACSGVHGANRLASNSLLEGLVFAWRAVRDIEKQGANSPQKVRFAPCNKQDANSLQIAGIREHVRQRMFADAGVLREGRRLAELEAELKKIGTTVPLSANQESRELHNLLTVAGLIVKGALWRKESRGGHFRSDYPCKNADFARCHRPLNEKEDGTCAPIAV
ncbi:L-aspartate oxidase [Dethiobacter alkaliphilus]|uniref:L-aspartate oxidase n=1 Tax=Dethiobacter alkaliphilus TaxID=427926 RepID=UPI002228038A|nr:L-aspartate oxidase [Dethiobacter alkaliphilus]MCW3491443.1 L-aspartate oxidase [Dethiobacter alkaliphilus]